MLLRYSLHCEEAARSNIRFVSVMADDCIAAKERTARRFEIISALLSAGSRCVEA